MSIYTPDLYLELRLLQSNHEMASTRSVSGSVKKHNGINIMSSIPQTRREFASLSDPSNVCAFYLARLDELNGARHSKWSEKPVHGSIK